MSDDYIADALQDATLSQILDEIYRRYGTIVFGIMRADPIELDKSMFAKCRRGNLIHQLGIVNTLRLEIEEDLMNVPETDMDDGN